MGALVERIANGTAVVTATRRLAQHLLDEDTRRQQAAGRRAWPTPKVHYLQDWLQEEWQGLPASGGRDPPLLLDGAQEQVLWEQVVDGVAPAEFQGDRTVLAAALKEAWASCRDWRLDVAEFPRPASDEVELFVRAAGAFEARLTAQGWISTTQLPEALLAAARVGAWRPRPMTWLGFDEMTPALVALCDALGGQGALRDMPERTAGAAGAAGIYPCPDESEEIRTAARWARGLLENGANGPIGIVFHALGQRRGEVVRVFSDVFDADDAEPEAALNGLAHVSLGRPLAEYPVVAHALLMLEALNAPPDIETLAELLRSPFLAGGITELHRRARFELELRREGRERWPLPLLAAAGASCPLLAKILNDARLPTLMRDERRSTTAWARWATQALELVGWPGERTQTSAEYQTVSAWHELLSRFAALSAVSRPLTMNEALRRIGRMARERLFQPQSDPAPVQILGLPEMAGLRFAHLWVAGMSDDAWPGVPRPNPYLPHELQRRLGMPQADAARELRFARRVSTALLAAAPAVTVSHAQWRGDVKLNVSPLFAHLPALGEVPRSAHAGHAHRVREAAPALESYADWQGPALGTPRLRGGASAIADQAACPFRAFARRRLSAVAPEIVKAGIDDATHGKLLHQVMEDLWTDLKTQAALAALSDDDQRRLVARHVDTVLGRQNHHGDSFRQAVLAIERERLAGLIHGWLQIERARPAFEVVAREAERSLAVGGIELQLRVDRIDRMADGSQLVIDYKSGRKKTAAVWRGDRPDEPQLPMYAIAQEPPADGIAFATLHKGGSGFTGLAALPEIANGISDVAVPKEPVAWDDLLAQWRGAITGLAAAFARGDARVDPKSGAACRYCEAMPLCRLHELRPLGASEEVEDE